MNEFGLSTGSMECVVCEEYGYVWCSMGWRFCFSAVAASFNKV